MMSTRRDAGHGQ